MNVWHVEVVSTLEDLSMMRMRSIAKPQPCDIAYTINALIRPATPDTQVHCCRGAERLIRNARVVRLTDKYSHVYFLQSILLEGDETACIEMYRRRSTEETLYMRLLEYL